MSNTQSKPILQRAVGAVFLLALIALVAVLLLQPSDKAKDSTVKNNKPAQPTISITANDKNKTESQNNESSPSLVLESTASNSQLEETIGRETPEVISEDLWQSVEQQTQEEITSNKPILIANADTTRTKPTIGQNNAKSEQKDTSKRNTKPEAPKTETAKPKVTTPKLELIADSEKSTSPTKPATQNNKAAANGKWYVQIGAFGNAANAQKLVNQYKQQGYNVRIQKDNNLNRVQIGPFATKQEAERVQSKTKTQSINPAVIHLP